MAKKPKKCSVTWLHKCSAVHQKMGSLGGERGILLKRSEDYSVIEFTKLALTAIRNQHNAVLIDYSEIHLADARGQLIEEFDGEDRMFWTSSLIDGNRPIKLILLTNPCDPSLKLRMYSKNVNLYGFVDFGSPLKAAAAIVSGPTSMHPLTQGSKKLATEISCLQRPSPYETPATLVTGASSTFLSPRPVVKSGKVNGSSVYIRLPGGRDHLMSVTNMNQDKAGKSLRYCDLYSPSKVINNNYNFIIKIFK